MSGLLVFVGAVGGFTIHVQLEWIDADANDCVDKAFLGFTQADVSFDEFGHHIRHIGRRERGADHFAKARLIPLATTNRDLVPLFIVLIDAQNANVAHMVVAAGIHTTGDVQIQFADIMQVIQIIEALHDRLRDRNRLGIS